MSTHFSRVSRVYLSLFTFYLLFAQKFAQNFLLVLIVSLAYSLSPLVSSSHVHLTKQHVHLKPCQISGSSTYFQYDILSFIPSILKYHLLTNRINCQILVLIDIVVRYFPNTFDIIESIIIHCFNRNYFKSYNFYEKKF